MRATPSFCSRLSRRGLSARWDSLGRSLRSDGGDSTFRNARTRLAEQPATTKNQDAPEYRRFQTTPRFSIYKLTEMQKTVDETADYKLVFYAPVDAVARIKNAIFETGAGMLGGGRYARCSFQTLGTGQFMPQDGSAPTRGRLGAVEVVEEYRVEITCHGKRLAKRAVRAMLNAHPYEVPVYEVYKTEFGFLPHQISITQPHMKGTRLGIMPRSPALYPGIQSGSPEEIGLNLNPPSKKERHLATVVKQRIAKQFSGAKVVAEHNKYTAKHVEKFRKLDLKSQAEDIAAAAAAIESKSDVDTIGSKNEAPLTTEEAASSKDEVKPPTTS
ncbi:hypothetical protein H072_1174 [Dactylellina haptotyla CBS 200.50]|uniref:ATP phosphoribosyltransferase n=1 Tax=Dactylellina haptotyla (strain CBS 200.50) TaxID=1284197 RepID=S8APD9_DACHA|nr:hypothetical protein H072_1174 [Dactylellina haptotyla CBS 200.50]